MSLLKTVMVPLCLLTLAGAAAPAQAVVPVSFGTSWDGPTNELQAIVDNVYGAGNINVHADYIGAHVGDLDPWFWVGDHFSALLIKEVAGNADRNTLGWYLDTGVNTPSTPPTLLNDNIHDGVVFDGPSNSGKMKIVTFGQAMTKFGFYLNPNGDQGSTNAPEPELFFTNRFYNDIGPDGSGPLHTPNNGDVQALVFDISNLTQPNTWLVCFEDLDSGANPSDCCTSTDNDYNDLIFEVTALGATPVVPMSFGALKAKYHH